MSVGWLQIDRLNIVLHGVSSLVAEQALAELDEELSRRLGGMRGGWHVAPLSSMRLGPLDLPPEADAAALRRLIAEGLLQALFKPAGTDPAEDG